MADPKLVEHAKRLLKSDPDYLSDARQFAAAGNSIVGSVMNITFRTPRQYTEALWWKRLRRSMPKQAERRIQCNRRS